MANTFNFSRHVPTGNVTTVEVDEEYRGRWWILGNPDVEHVGVLKITPASGIWLTLDGSFRESEDWGELVDVPIIVGVQPNGYPFTLDGCQEQLRKEPMMGGYTTQRFAVSRVFGNVLAERGEEDLQFQRFTFRVTYLSEWLRNVGLSDPKRTPEGFFVEFDPTSYTTTPEMQASLEAAHVKVISKPRVSGSRPGEVAVKVYDRVEVRMAGPTTVDALRESVLEPFRDFVSLATAQPNAVTSLNAVVPVRPEGAGEMYEKQVVIYDSGPYEAPPLRSLFNRGAVVFYASDIAAEPEAYLSAWFSLESEMRDVCELFFGAHYDLGAFGSNRLLNVAAALEGYSNARYSGRAEPSREFRARKTRVLDAVDDDDRDWLRNALRFVSNGRTLRDRLAELVQVARPASLCLAPDPSLFADWAASTRNSLAHQGGGRRGNVAVGVTREILTECLFWLLRVQFLREVGFTGDKIHELLKRQRGFRELSDLGPELMPWKRTAGGQAVVP